MPAFDKTARHKISSEPIQFPTAPARRLDGWLSPDDVRAGACCLTSRDFALLESLLHRRSAFGPALPPPLAHLVRTKLSHARLVLPADVGEDVATLNSRVVFSVDRRPDEMRVLVHADNHYALGQGLGIDTVLGATLLGMRAEQDAILLHADGTAGHVLLKHVAYQPEAARQRQRQDSRSRGPQ